MKKSLLSALFLSLLLASSLAVADPAATSNSVQPDNSAINSRDHHPAAKTADHQVKALKSDAELTRMVRRELTKDSELSIYGKNVKIITLDGVMTLRGPVHTEAEKTKIATIAQRVMGESNLQNELEIKHQ